MSELNEGNAMNQQEPNQGLVGEELIEGGLGHDIEGDKFLTFRLNNTVYGVEITRIKEIIEYGGITRIPMTPPCIRGVINLRGNVVPVVDMAERLEVGHETDVSRRTCVIITEMEDEGEKMDIGFVVDAVDQVVGIHEDHIEATPSFGTDVKSEFIAGMGNVNEKFVILLDVDTVFDVEALGTLVEQAIE
ncbi:MAG: chemotaxis protein CheW [Gammaproteobacteria bacterium]|nr:chemotaxis protein CheW [Gammaproteobacteria bacterium]